MARRRARINRRTGPPLRRISELLMEREAWSIYAYLSLIGIVALLDRGHGFSPGTVREVLPAWLIVAWTAAVALGGLGVLAGWLGERTRIESASCALLAFGAFLYGLCVTVAAWPKGATVIAVSAAVLTMCITRMRTLSRARRAQREATRILRDEEK